MKHTNRSLIIVEGCLTGIDLSLLLVLFFAHGRQLLQSLRARQYLPEDKEQRITNAIRWKTSASAITICLLQSWVVVISFLLTTHVSELSPAAYSTLYLIVDIAGVVMINEVLLAVARTHVSCLINLVKRRLPIRKRVATIVSRLLVALEILLIIGGVAPRITADILYFSESNPDPKKTHHSHNREVFHVIAEKVFDSGVVLNTLFILASSTAFATMFLRNTSFARNTVILIKGMILSFAAYSILRALIVIIQWFIYDYASDPYVDRDVNRVWSFHATVILQCSLMGFQLFFSSFISDYSHWFTKNEFNEESIESETTLCNPDSMLPAIP